MRRRDFLALSSSLGLAGLAGLGGLRRSRAATPLDHLIVVLAYGGWDPTFALDPHPGSDAVDHPAGRLVGHGAHRLWLDPSRPAVTRFFDAWGDLSVVVNGLSVDSLVHETCARHVLTGGASSDLATLVAAERGRDLPLPVLSLASQAKPGPLAALTGSLGFTNQLLSLVRPDQAYPIDGRQDPGLLPSPAQRALLERFHQQSHRRWADRPWSPEEQRRLADVPAARQRAAALRAFSQRHELGEAGLYLDLGAQWPVVVEAFAEGFSQTAILQSDGWDDHSEIDQQGARWNGLFADLDALCAALDARALLDRSLILVCSEMGRTPLRNGAAGKDHWPFTSALAISPRLRPGTIGATDDALRPLPTDLRSGLPHPDGSLLRPSHLLAAIGLLMGLSPTDRFDPPEVLHALLD